MPRGPFSNIQYNVNHSILLDHLPSLELRALFYNSSAPYEVIPVVMMGQVGPMGGSLCDILGFGLLSLT